jgi:peptidoglycan/LPS O-acetylase OafA/YrhL
MLGYWEEAVGMGQPETSMGNFGLVLAQFALGGAAAAIVSPMDRKYAVIEGGVAAVALAQAAQAIVPMSGVLFWLRTFAIPSGAGAVVGIWQQKQWERELRASYELDRAQRLASRARA